MHSSWFGGAARILTAIGLLGCSTPIDRVRSSFSGTFECEKVTVKEERAGHYVASGCGRTGRYECNRSRCEPEGGMAQLLGGNEKPKGPTVRQLWLTLKLHGGGTLSVTAEPETTDTVTMTVISGWRDCELAVAIDGERLQAHGEAEPDSVVLTRQTARQLASAHRVVLQACRQRWVLDQEQMRQVSAFVLRFEDDLALENEAPPSGLGAKLPPQGGWQSWSALNPLPAPVAGAALEGTALFRKLSPSVLRIEASRQLGDATGSAVAVTASRAITNCHVLEGALKITARQGDQQWSARLVSSDARGDRCVLELTGSPLTPIAGVRTYTDLQVGEPLYTLGAPSGLELSLASGLLSALRELDGSKYVQTTAPISPGSSGGGLFDARGNLVGITTLALVGQKNLNQALNFAIPAEAFWRP